MEQMKDKESLGNVHLKQTKEVRLPFSEITATSFYPSALQGHAEK